MRQANKSFIQYILLIGLVFSFNNSIFAQTEDFGDAPDSYLTLDASGGPKHTTTATLTLGSTFDLEADGVPDNFAYGDDNAGSDDEDGELFRSLVPGTTYSDDIVVVNTSGSSALLNVWVDYNIDGDFLDAGEQVATDQTVANGANTATVSFAVPASPTLGQSYVRIRLCSSGCNTPGGAAGDGEVEDYVVVIMTTMPCSSNAYIVQSDISLWNNINLVTGVKSIADDNYGGHINAIGYNQTDGRIWGYDRGGNTGSLTVTVLTAGTWTTQIIGPITGLPTGTYYNGEVSANGVLYLNSNTTTMQTVDVNPSSSTYLDHLGTISYSGGTLNAGDMAFHDTDGFIYSVDQSDNLYQVNSATGAIINLGSAGVGLCVNGWGAQFMDNKGFMYAFCNTTGEIYRLDLTSLPVIGNFNSGNTVLFSTILGSLVNDGARCSSAEINLDFGDIDNTSVATLLEDDGPRHFLRNYNVTTKTADLMIGSIVDADNDGFPTTASDGDDTDNVNDEDGVASFPTQAVAGVYTLTGISTTNTTGGDAMLCGWFDFNQDGSFDNNPNTSTTGDDPNVGSAVDSGERSCIIIADGTTSADLSWTIPTAELLNTGNFYFRFRITSDDRFFLPTSPSPIGAVIDGEVEDYLAVDVLPVELSYFGVESTNAGVLAKWTTESETENLGFTLDRRVVGTQGWNQIASYQTNDALLGQGSTPSATDYEYLDALVEASTTYEYRLADVDYNNTVTYHATRTVTVGSTPSTREVPDEFTVKEAYPNPFNPSTTIDYSLPVIASGAPQTGQAQQSQVQLQIYDITGKLINTLIDQVQPSGWHSVQWNGKDQVGANVPAGAYLVRVKAGTDVRHTKVMLLK